MLISETYLKKYEKTIYRVSSKVNEYLQKNNFNTSIQPSFFLRFLANKTLFYNEIIIYQKNKQRILHEPIIELKYIQKFILHNIFYNNQHKYNFESCVAGYMKSRSILYNASFHLNKKAIIKMDLKDFFPSISRRMVYDAFRKYNQITHEEAYILSHLVTYKDSLPQGAPTSPYLANLCAKGLDFKINRLLKKINNEQALNIQYTRYADDITISFDKKFNYDYIVNTVIDIILSEGFYPNFKKTKIIKHNQCQKVTGIVVNNIFPSIEKKEQNKLKFILNIWKKYGIQVAIELWNKYKFGTGIHLDDEKCKLKFLQVIEGKIMYFNMVNKKQNQILLESYNKLLEQYVANN